MKPNEIRDEISRLSDRIAELKAMLPKEGRKLTAAFCRDVKHSGARGTERHTAGAQGYGLALVVKPSGSKAFTQRLTIGGRRTDAGLGSYPEVSLAAARDAAFENRRIVRGGGGLADLVRPSGAPPAPKPRSAPGVPTLEEAALRTIEVQAQSWRDPRTRKSWESNLRLHAFPALGSMPVSRIEAPDILAVVEPLWGSKRRPMSDMLNRLSLIFRWAIAQSYRTDDPTAAVRAALPRNGAHRGHFAALPHVELADALAAALGCGAQRSASLALAFAVLTACRSGEVRGARWAEVDREARTLTIPGSRMKAGKEHVVPLSRQALAILEEARGLGGAELVFPAPRGGELWEKNLGRVLRRAGYETATVHGMRAAFRDWCAENGVDRHQAEMALAHSVGGVEGAYLRTKRIEERRLLMQRWADYVQGEGAR